MLSALASELSSAYLPLLLLGRLYRNTSPDRQPLGAGTTTTQISSTTHLCFSKAALSLA